jgi:hypothetical protein
MLLCLVGTHSQPPRRAHLNLYDQKSILIVLKAGLVSMPSQNLTKLVSESTLINFECDESTH